MLTILQKELRATAWVVALGAVVLAWFVSEMMGSSSSNSFRGWFPMHEGQHPFVSPGWLLWWGFLSAGFAGGLGLVMSLNESARGMWAFVLFRPISRRRFVGTKLLLGSVLSLLVVGIPAFVFLWWSSLLGNLPIPFDWSFAQPACESMGWSVVVFLGGFLSGLRPASWWWSRLWPLGATVVLGLWLWLSSFDTSLPDLLVPSPLQFWIVCVVTSALLVSSILHVVEERDFA